MADDAERISTPQWTTFWPNTHQKGAIPSSFSVPN